MIQAGSKCVRLKDVTYQEDDQLFFIHFKQSKSKYFQETQYKLDYDKEIFPQNKSDSYHALSTIDESSAQKNTPPSTPFNQYGA